MPVGGPGCRLPRNERTITLYKQDQKASHGGYQSLYYLSHTDCFILHPRALERMRRAQPRCPRCWRLSAVQANAIRPVRMHTMHVHEYVHVAWVRRGVLGRAAGRQPAQLWGVLVAAVASSMQAGAWLCARVMLYVHACTPGHYMHACSGCASPISHERHGHRQPWAPLQHQLYVAMMSMYRCQRCLVGPRAPLHPHQVPATHAQLGRVHRGVLASPALYIISSTTAPAHKQDAACLGSKDAGTYDNMSRVLLVPGDVLGPWHITPQCTAPTCSAAYCMQRASIAMPGPLIDTILKCRLP